jgi:hypothetical protein
VRSPRRSGAHDGCASATFADSADLAFGEEAIVQVANADRIEAIGDECIVAELEEFVDPRDDVRLRVIARRDGEPCRR